MLHRPEQTAKVRKTPGPGRLELAFARAASGQTFLEHQYSSYPFHVCRALHLDDDRPGMATVYTQSCSGGLYTQDSLLTTARVGPHAQAHLTTQASTIVHRATRGAAEQVVHCEAGEAAFLEYLPDPVILLPGSELISRLKVKADPTATVILCDAFLSHDPDGQKKPFGTFRSEVVIEDPAGRPAVIDRFHVRGEDVAEERLGVTGNFSCQAMVMAYSPAHDVVALLAAVREAERMCEGVEVGTSELPGGCGVWARILARDGADLKDATVALWSALRVELLGQAPSLRRK